MHDPVHFSPEEKGVYFSFEHPEFELADQARWKNWLLKCIHQSEAEFDRLNFVFCTDDFLLKINQSYLSHDDFTDIITFCLNEHPIQGEIYISIDRVRENATELSILFEEELKRVMSHGILHLVGFRDKTATDIVIMRKKESEYISLWI